MARSKNAQLRPASREDVSRIIKGNLHHLATVLYVGWQPCGVSPRRDLCHSQAIWWTSSSG